MGALAFNFFKRAVLVPALITALVLAAVTWLLPQQVTRSVAQVNSSYTAKITPSSFNTIDYDAFSQLTDGAYVGTLDCEEPEIPAVAVLYGTENKNHVGMAAYSSEPWGENNGILLIGANTINQFSALHNAKIGTVFTFSFHGNGSRQYTVKRIVSCCSEEDIASFCQPKTLVLCLPYRDLSDEDAPMLYTVYAAKEV